MKNRINYSIRRYQVFRVYFSQGRLESFFNSIKLFFGYDVCCNFLAHKIVVPTMENEKLFRQKENNEVDDEE